MNVGYVLILAVLYLDNTHYEGWGLWCVTTHCKFPWNMQILWWDSYCSQASYTDIISSCGGVLGVFALGDIKVKWHWWLSITIFNLGLDCCDEYFEITKIILLSEVISPITRRRQCCVFVFIVVLYFPFLELVNPLKYGNSICLESLSTD